MKTPIWLSSYESTLRARQRRQKNKTTMRLLLMPVLYVIVGLIIMYFNRNAKVDLMPYLGWVGGILGLSSFVALAFGPQRLPEDEAKTVRDIVTRLISTEEEREEFDHQLCGRPNYSIEVNDGSLVGITDNYVVSRYESCGKLSYRIAKLAEIAGSRLVEPKGDAQGADRKYVVDLLNSEGERLMAIWVDGASKMEQLEEALAKTCPGLVLRDCKAF